MSEEKQRELEVREMRDELDERMDKGMEEQKLKNVYQQDQELERELSARPASYNSLRGEGYSESQIPSWIKRPDEASSSEEVLGEVETPSRGLPYPLTEASTPSRGLPYPLTETSTPSRGPPYPRRPP